MQRVLCAARGVLVVAARGALVVAALFDKNPTALVVAALAMV